MSTTKIMHFQNELLLPILHQFIQFGKHLKDELKINKN